MRRLLDGSLYHEKIVGQEDQNDSQKGGSEFVPDGVSAKEIKSKAQ